MARGKRTDSETKAKIIEAKINNPDLSSRDIEKETGIPHETTAKVIREDLAQVCTQSETISKLIDDNNQILNLTGGLLLDKLKAGESVRIDELIKSRDMAFKQNELTKAMGNADKEIVVKFEL